MTDPSHPAGPIRRWRAARRRRADDRRAVRAEFELVRPRGLAALRAYAQSVGELERARIASHRAPEQRPVSPVGVSAARGRATLR